MLQKHLIGPLPIDVSELLLCLNLVVIDAQKLALFASMFYFGQLGRSVLRGTGNSETPIGLRFKSVVLSHKAGSVRSGLLDGLLNQLIAAALREPSPDSSSQCAVSPRRENRNLTLIPELRFVFVCGRLVRRKLLLNFGALVAGRSSEILLRILEFVLVERKLRLGNFQIVGARSLLVAIHLRCRRTVGRRCQVLHSSLIFFHNLLKLRDFLGLSKRVAGKRLSLRGGLAQR